MTPPAALLPSICSTPTRCSAPLAVNGGQTPTHLPPVRQSGRRRRADRELRRGAGPAGSRATARTCLRHRRRRGSAPRRPLSLRRSSRACVADQLEHGVPDRARRWCAGHFRSPSTPTRLRAALLAPLSEERGVGTFTVATDGSGYFAAAISNVISGNFVAVQLTAPSASATVGVRRELRRQPFLAECAADRRHVGGRRLHRRARARPAGTSSA